MSALPRFGRERCRLRAGHCTHQITATDTLTIAVRSMDRALLACPPRSPPRQAGQPVTPDGGPLQEAINARLSAKDGNPRRTAVRRGQGVGSSLSDGTA
jgi:hypothetical protein